jgi:hypothetical protein
MNKHPKPLSQIREGQMKLVALLMFIAAQKQKNLDTMNQLFSRLMLPGKH